MAKVTITTTNIKCTLVVLKGPNNERIVTGTDLPFMCPKRDILDQMVSLAAAVGAAKAALSKREGWSMELWKCSFLRDKETNRIYKSNIKVCKENKSEQERIWVGGWPYYMLPDDSGPARLSTKLIQQTLDNHSIHLSSENAVELGNDTINAILEEVDNQE